MDIQKVWARYLKNRGDADRNLLLENYLPLVQLLARRLWAKMPPGAALPDNWGKPQMLKKLLNRLSPLPLPKALQPAKPKRKKGAN